MLSSIVRMNRKAALAVVVAPTALLLAACNSSSPAASAPSPSVSVNPEPGVVYAAFVKSQVDQLVTTTTTFVNAIKAGNLAAAKSDYILARVHYEEIEPVADSFEDLDPAIDAKISDVAPGDQWMGFHRLEKGIFTDNSLAGLDPIADQLVRSVTELQTLVATAAYDPIQIASGAVDLMEEVSDSKVTGIEEAYSHEDLAVFQANVLGAQESYSVVEPEIAQKDPALDATIKAAFTKVFDALDAYKRDGSFVSYTTVTQDERRALSNVVNGLAEPLSKVPALI